MSMRFRALAESEGFPLEDLQMYARDFARLECKDDRTTQADKDACDITRIMRQNLESGIMPQTRQVPQFADVSDIGSLQDALQVVADAGEFFMNLPARTRDAFGNDPTQFVLESQDATKFSKFQALGLAPKDEATPAGGVASGGTGAT